jgi:type IV secretion system protein VirB8
MVQAAKSQQKLKLKSWYSNRYQIVVVQRNILLFFTLVSMLSVTIAVIFVKNIMSSKSLEPYVIEVEAKTGVATVVSQLTAQNFSGDQMVRRYFINQFVQAASAYDPVTYRLDLEKVRLLSASRVYSDFRRRIDAKQLGAESRYQVRIKSIQFPEPNTAQIRVLRQIDLPNSDPTSKNEIITMKFYFSPNMELSMEDRLINPLGFQVSEYNISEEAFSY